MQNQKRGGHRRQPGGVPTPRRLGGAPKRVVPRPRRRADGRRERPRARRGFSLVDVDGRSVLEAGIQQRLAKTAVAEALSPSETGLSSSVATRHDAPCFSTRLDRSAAPASVGPVEAIARAAATAIGRANARSTQRTAVSAGVSRKRFVRRSCFFFLSFASRLLRRVAERGVEGGDAARAGRVHATARARTRDHPLAIRRRPLHRRAQARLRQRGPARDAHQTLAQRRGDERRVGARRASVAFGFFLVKSVRLVTRNASGIHRFRNASRKSSARNASAFAARSRSLSRVG